MKTDLHRNMLTPDQGLDDETGSQEEPRILAGVDRRQRELVVGTLARFEGIVGIVPQGCVSTAPRRRLPRESFEGDGGRL